MHDPRRPTFPELRLPVPAPPADAPLEAAVRAELEALASDLHFLTRGDLGALRAGDDPRAAWVVADLLRFHQGGPLEGELTGALSRLTGLPPDVAWVDATNALLAADLPAFPGYLELKRRIHLAVDDRWRPFFDEDADVDWREVAWGGVLRDGIPHLDDPRVEDASSTWIPDDEVVVGVVVGGEARAYPRRVLEIHEMVNDTLGGVRFGLPYCTLCGTATAYRTDGIPGLASPGALRTSGLLQRSNKLVYEATTESLVHPFLGVGLSGPLRGVQLERLPVVTTTWGAWRAAHPSTTVVARDARGRPYPADPLQGRDDDGPIFPIGTSDLRLGVQDVVLGVEAPDGTAVAFPAAAARAALAAGARVALAGVEVGLRRDGGLVAVDPRTGRELASHEAFWFAWSQFRPDALLWQPDA